MTMDTYRALIEQTPPNALITLLERGLPATRGILGSQRFLGRLPRRTRSRFENSEAYPSLDQLVAYIARLHKVSTGEIVSRSRAHRLVVARVQVVWYATERAGIPLTNVARHLNRSASTLSRVRSTYCRKHPELLSADMFAGLATE